MWNLRLTRRCRVRLRIVASRVRREPRAPKVSDSARSALVGHARRVKPGREVVGILVERGGVVIRYQPLKNISKQQGKFVCRNIHIRNWTPGEHMILVHSHPYGNNRPSRGDLKMASKAWLGRLYAIYGLESDELGFYVLDEKRRGYRRVGRKGFIERELWCYD